jgi:membrane protein YdbS with pleckstrin-like domain
MNGTAVEESRALQFTRLNWALLTAAALFVALGYVSLASSSPVVSTVIAPVLLVVAYAVLIPLGIIL